MRGLQLSCVLLFAAFLLLLGAGEFSVWNCDTYSLAVIVETSGFGVFNDREKLALLRRLAEARGLVAVSYTHLDVYKRQGLRLWRRAASPRRPGSPLRASGR